MSLLTSTWQMRYHHDVMSLNIYSKEKDAGQYDGVFYQGWQCHIWGLGEDYEMSLFLHRMKEVDRIAFIVPIVFSSPAKGSMKNQLYSGNHPIFHSQTTLFPLSFFLNLGSNRPIGWSKILVGVGVGWVMGGKIHAQRKEKKLNQMHKKEQKALYSQYYNDVYQLQQQNAEMVETLKQLGYRVK